MPILGAAAGWRGLELESETGKIGNRALHRVHIPQLRQQSEPELSRDLERVSGGQECQLCHRPCTALVHR